MAALNLPRDRYSNGEREPLLPSPPALHESLTQPKPRKEINPKINETRPWRLLVTLIVLLIVAFNLGGFLSEPPKIRIYEANLCVRYYERNDVSKVRPDGSVDEALCKVNEIQQHVAMGFGWQDTFDAIPGILLAVPFGTLADKWGRKWILATTLLGLQLGMAWVLFICTSVFGHKFDTRKAHELCRLFQNLPSQNDMVLLCILRHRGRTQCRYGCWSNHGVRCCAIWETGIYICLSYCERTCG